MISPQASEREPIARDNESEVEDVHDDTVGLMAANDNTSDNQLLNSTKTVETVQAFDMGASRDTAADYLNDIDEEDDEMAEVRRDEMESAPPLRRVILTVIPIFMGYAALVSLQRRVREQIGIVDSNSHIAYVYGVGVSLIFLGNLIFRFMHNILLACLTPRRRIFFAYICMIAVMVITVLLFYIFPQRAVTTVTTSPAAYLSENGTTTHTSPPNYLPVVFVFMVYGLAGVAIGTFEANVVSVITPLGHQTKTWAIMGMPVGYNGTTIGTFLFFLIDPTNPMLEAIVFGVVAVMNILGALIFYIKIPDVNFEASKDGARSFLTSLFHWRKFKRWFPIMWQNILVMMFNMFSVITMSSIVLYIFDLPHIPLWAGGPSIPKDAFQAVYNFHAFLGDFVSRKVIYIDGFPLLIRRNPLIFLMLTAVGITFGLLKIGILAWLGMFLVMFGNGSIYGATTKHVDEMVPRQFNLVALSMWLFIGDLGSTIASNLTNYITVHLGTVKP